MTEDRKAVKNHSFNRSASVQALAAHLQKSKVAIGSQDSLELIAAHRDSSHNHTEDKEVSADDQTKQRSTPQDQACAHFDYEFSIQQTSQATKSSSEVCGNRLNHPSELAKKDSDLPSHTDLERCEAYRDIVTDNGDGVMQEAAVKVVFTQDKSLSPDQLHTGDQNPMPFLMTQDINPQLCQNSPVKQDIEQLRGIENMNRLQDDNQPIEYASSQNEALPSTSSQKKSSTKTWTSSEALSVKLTPIADTIQSAIESECMSNFKNPVFEHSNHSSPVHEEQNTPRSRFLDEKTKNGKDDRRIASNYGTVEDHRTAYRSPVFQRALRISKGNRPSHSNAESCASTKSTPHDGQNINSTQDTSSTSHGSERSNRQKHESETISNLLSSHKENAQDVKEDMNTFSDQRGTYVLSSNTLTSSWRLQGQFCSPTTSPGANRYHTHSSEKSTSQRDEDQNSWPSTLAFSVCSSPAILRVRIQSWHMTPPAFPKQTKATQASRWWKTSLKVENVFSAKKHNVKPPYCWRFEVTSIAVDIILWNCIWDISNAKKTVELCCFRPFLRSLAHTHVPCSWPRILCEPSH